MSAILDSALDAERREQCEVNDRHMAAGEPLGDECVVTPPPIPQALRRGAARRPMTNSAMLKASLLAWSLGFIVGLPTSAHQPKVHPKLQMDRCDVQRVPGQPLTRTPQRTVV